VAVDVETFIEIDAVRERVAAFASDPRTLHFDPYAVAISLERLSTHVPSRR
jgi:hypothetical protein